MKNFLITIIGLAILVAAIFFMMRGTEDVTNSVEQQTDNEHTIVDPSSEVPVRASESTMSYVLENASGAVQATITFDENNTHLATLVVGDVEYSLEQVETASGIRYESADGAIVYVEHQGEAQIEMNGKVLYDDLSPEVMTEDKVDSTDDVDGMNDDNTDEADTDVELNGEVEVEAESEV